MEIKNSLSVLIFFPIINRYYARSLLQKQILDIERSHLMLTLFFFAYITENLRFLLCIVSIAL